MRRKSSVILHMDLSPMWLFWVSIFFFSILEMLTYAKFGALITIIPDTLFLLFLADSIVTKIRNVRQEHKPELHIQDNHSQNDPYDHLVETLNKIKHGNASKKHKIAISIDLIEKANLHSDEKIQLINQTNSVYKDEK